MRACFCARAAKCAFSPVGVVANRFDIVSADNARRWLFVSSLFISVTSPDKHAFCRSLHARTLWPAMTHCIHFVWHADCTPRGILLDADGTPDSSARSLSPLGESAAALPARRALHAASHSFAVRETQREPDQCELQAKPFCKLPPYGAAQRFSENSISLHERVRPHVCDLDSHSQPRCSVLNATGPSEGSFSSLDEYSEMPPCCIAGCMVTASVGGSEGVMVGIADGANEGTCVVGSVVPNIAFVGTNEGDAVGVVDGTKDGTSDGMDDGFIVGAELPGSTQYNGQGTGAGGC